VQSSNLKHQASQVIPLQTLLDYCQQRLDVIAFDDYCPNGLQVEGKGEVRRLVTGVTASLALAQAAVEAGADTLLVHHGYFWKNEPAPIVGMKGERIRLLLQHQVNLLAYHLPLDAHPELGNNVKLGELIGCRSGAPVAAGGLLWGGELPEPATPGELADILSSSLDREPLLIVAGEHPIQRLAWCTGGAQGMIEQAADLGFDAYITGEVSESTVHVARERGIHFYAAGHHATERYGVQALGEELAARFDLQHQFIDIPNPV
jgi:dinuclear metal center YbgI/SA1388 family protein